MVPEKNKANFNTIAANTLVLTAIGIFLGNLAGIGFVLGEEDTLSYQIAAVFIRIFHVHTSLADFCASLGGAQEFVLTLLLGLVIAPAIMSGIARRVPILWGVLPTVVLCFWLTADYMSENSIKFSLFSVVNTFLLHAELILIGLIPSFVVYAVKHSIFRRHSSQWLSIKSL